ncbi:hypothetical protein E4U43_004402 [Claviceps pusilla]|uniref:Uncharacterized protein n=1 Tax=Claviceps pusilla TaxID=123648 RepID=A0A9P7SW59_9HYPO|nr:hypothetical protein E4U43_004402 [Claviceps pusilla]
MPVGCQPSIRGERAKRPSEAAKRGGKAKRHTRGVDVLNGGRFGGGVASTGQQMALLCLSCSKGYQTRTSKTRQDMT